MIVNLNFELCIASNRNNRLYPTVENDLSNFQLAPSQYSHVLCLMLCPFLIISCINKLLKVCSFPRSINRDSFAFKEINVFSLLSVKDFLILPLAKSLEKVSFKIERRLSMARISVSSNNPSL